MDEGLGNVGSSLVRGAICLRHYPAPRTCFKYFLVQMIDDHIVKNEVIATYQ